MTENEAIKILRNNFPKTCKMVDGRYKGGFDDVKCEFGQALLLSISALTEIQQYQAIGTVDECWEAMGRQSAKKPIKTPDCSDCEKECNQNCISFNYGETYLCPTCHQNEIFNSEYDMFYKFCKNCGQAIEWSE